MSHDSDFTLIKTLEFTSARTLDWLLESLEKEYVLSIARKSLRKHLLFFVDVVNHNEEGEILILLRHIFSKSNNYSINSDQREQCKKYLAVLKDAFTHSETMNIVELLKKLQLTGEHLRVIFFKKLLVNEDLIPELKKVLETLVYIKKEVRLRTSSIKIFGRLKNEEFWNEFPILWAQNSHLPKYEEVLVKEIFEYIGGIDILPGRLE